MSIETYKEYRKEKVAVIKQGPFDTKEQAPAARPQILEG